MPNRYRVSGAVLESRSDADRLLNSARVITDDTAISCGVTQVSNVAGLERVLTDIPKAQRGAAIKALLNGVKASEQAAFLVMSNNKDTPLTNEALTAACPTKTRWRVNPNSDNAIKVWVF